MFTRGKQTEAQTIRSLFRKHTEMLSRKDNIHDISKNALQCPCLWLEDKNGNYGLVSRAYLVYPPLRMTISLGVVMDQGKGLFRGAELFSHNYYGLW